MEIVKECPRMDDGWYYPAGDGWWHRIAPSFTLYLRRPLVAPNKFLFIKVNKNNTTTDEVCDFISQNIEKLSSRYNLVTICDYSYVMRDEDKDTRIIILNLLVKK